MDNEDRCPLGPKPPESAMPEKKTHLSYKELCRLLEKTAESQSRTQKLAEKLAEDHKVLQRAQMKSQKQIDQLLRYCQNRDRDLEQTACTCLFNHLNKNFRNARQISRPERFFCSGATALEYDGGVVFEDSQDGNTIQYLALLEAKQNRDQFHSYAQAKARLDTVQELINSKDPIPPTISRRLKSAMEKQRRFYGCRVILFFAANNMDTATRDNCFRHNISVIIPNGRNFNVEIAPTSMQR